MNYPHWLIEKIFKNLKVKTHKLPKKIFFSTLI
jgi:hypothetical protein